MTFRGDDRAASVQVGAILLFGMLVVAVAGWQAQVVPQENAEVEYTHSQRVGDDMQDVRNEIVSAPGRTSLRSVSVEMAPEYPPRTIFVNPGPPSGTLRTVGTTDGNLNVTIDNAEATDGEAADYWDGSARDYGTGGLVYSPGYNVHTGAPDTVYENTVLYDDHGDTAVTVASQDLVEGKTISLVTLNGSLDRTAGGTYSVDFRALSSSTRTVSVIDDSSGGNVTVSFASRRDAAWWNETLAGAGELSHQDGHVFDVRPGSPASVGEFHNVTVEFEGDTTYRLRMAKVGVGSGTEGSEEAYVTDVEGDGSSVPEGSTQTLVVEVRDEYNNPVGNVTVEGHASSGSLASTTATTDDEGRASFTYQAPGVDGASSESVDVNVTMDGGVDPTAASFDPGTPANVQLAVTVQNSDGSGLGGGGGGGGAYTTSWQNPDGQTGVTCDASGDDCTVNASQTNGVTLTAMTSPTATDATVDFAINDTSAGTISPTEAQTDSSGEADTTFSPDQNEGAKVYASSGGNGDVINLTVENVVSGPHFAVAIDGTNEPVTEGEDLTVDVTVENTGDTDATQDVVFEVDGGEQDRRTDQTIASGDSATYTFTYTTEDGDAPDVDVTVSSEDDSDSTTATVNEATAPFFAVTVDDTNSPIDEGETLDVTATVENTGDSADTQDVTLTVGGVQRDVQSVSLNSGGSQTITLSWATADGDAGDYTAEAASQNDTDTAPVTVKQVVQLNLTANRTTVSEGDTVEFTVTDDAGDPVENADVPVTDDGDGSEVANLTTDANGVTTYTFQNAGDYTAVATKDDTATETYLDSGAVSITVEQSNPPSLDTFEITDNSNGGQGARYDVTWGVSDPDGDLDTVTVYVNNTDASSTTTYAGPSGTETYNPGGSGDWQDTHEFKIVAEDADGNRACHVITDVADGDPNGALSIANGYGTSC